MARESALGPSSSPAILRRFALEGPAELKLVLWSAGYFFFIFSSYYLARPVREAMGIERSADDLPWLMTGTMAAMFVVNPLFSALVSRFARRRFIPWSYHFFAATMLVFGLLLWRLPPARILYAGYAFYIWLSVFNLFAVSLFWSLMADVFSREQGKRLFPLIGIGGTLGGIAGPAAAGLLVSHTGPGLLLVIAAVILEGVVVCVRVLTGLAGLRSAAPPTAEPGPGILTGLVLVARSPYLLLICAHLFLYTLISTFLYLEQGRIVNGAVADRAARTALFASIDFWANALTLTVQLLIGGRLLTWLGVGFSLALIPALSAVGFAALWAAPMLALSPLAVIVTIQIVRRGLQYSLSNPGRQVLFTVVGPDEKYKSKTFIDTFVYRGGDLAGAWAPRAIVAAGAVVPAVAIPISAVGIGVALVLGKMLALRRDPRPPPLPSNTCAACGYSLAGINPGSCPECGAPVAGPAAALSG